MYNRTFFSAHEVRPEDIGLITVRGDDATHPFMVAFLKASTSIKPRHTREIRSRVKKSDMSNIFGPRGTLFLLSAIIDSSKETISMFH